MASFPQETFHEDVTTPLAQIIMLDADHGDCNFVDFCVENVLSNRHRRRSYQRHLIDTGPPTNKGFDNLKRVIKTYQLPKMVKASGVVDDVEGENMPHKLDTIIHTIQFTHSDNDHCGLADKLFLALRSRPADESMDEPMDQDQPMDTNLAVEAINEDTEEWIEPGFVHDQDLQSKFSKTNVVFHQLPSQTPKHELNVHGRDSMKVSVTSGWCTEVEKYGIISEYTFTVAGQQRTKDGPNYILLKDGDFTATGGRARVECKVILSFREASDKIKFTRSRPFKMRPNHQAVFTIVSEYLKTDAGGLKLASPKEAEQNQPPAPLDEENDTRTPAKPQEERVLANQRFYRIENAMSALTRDKPDEVALVNPIVFSPVQGDINSGNTSLAKLTFVGPTKTLYNQLLLDCLKVEYHQSTYTKKETKAVGSRERRERLEDALAKAKMGVTVELVAQGDEAQDPAAKDTLRMAYAKERQFAAQLDFDNRDKAPASGKDGDVHNMASIISLFQRQPIKSDPAVWNFKMLFTGDAFERDCSIRNTLDSLVKQEPELVDVLKIPHHGSLRTTSVEFYHRIRARVYLICAKQTIHSAPYLSILEAIVSHTNSTPADEMTYLFFSNPTSLYNGSPIKLPKPITTPSTGPTPSTSMETDQDGVSDDEGASANNEQDSSNLNQLLSGPFGPGKPGPGETNYNYTCCILKHYDEDNTATGEKNAGIILLGHNKDNKLIVQAPQKYWDIWDKTTVNEAKMAKRRTLLPRTDKSGEAKKAANKLLVADKKFDKALRITLSEMDKKSDPEFYRALRRIEAKRAHK